MPVRNLQDYLEASTRSWPDRTAAVDPDGSSLTYRELNARSDAFAAFLVSRGVKRGDRVGVVVPKSVTALVSLFGIMKAGAAYVPVDFTAPGERGRRILTDCQVSALVVDSRAVEMLPEPSEKSLSAVVVAGGAHSGAGAVLGAVTLEQALQGGSLSTPGPPVGPDDLAYILYTSGSTGVPKGVMLTHRNATSFVDWCSSVFEPGPDDRFSSHAPFHFDLSVLDIYVAIKHGATLYLISEELGKSPKELARFVAANRLTIWYSTPSILTLLYQYGNLQAYDMSSLRIVLFAGEVFPVKHLREVKRHWPTPVYYNLYGPTETNVCTYARMPPLVPDDRDTPYPIGFLCSHCDGLVRDDEGREVTPGEEGLLYINGPSVFSGYWNRPAENTSVFLDHNGARWYNTGDVVRWNDADGFVYVGRKDRMVKRRGYRIELGEIERALYLHPQVQEAAVVSVADEDAGVKIVAFLSCRAAERPSIVDLKTFCSIRLPVYMSPDRFIVQDRLPKTSTDKVDYQSLRRQVQGL